MTDPTKGNVTQPLSFKEILDELEISEDDYYRAWPILKDKDLELTFKREPNSCFVNNYFDVGLKAWWVNMDIKSVLNEYKFFFSEKELRELPDDSPNIF